ncbi:histidine-containing phosphotransfer protein 2 [Hevea brasiliensis]|nr:histidine-containing phosphotransfer protein 2 [Hevea brasiliensis]
MVGVGESWRADKFHLLSAFWILPFLLAFKNNSMVGIELRQEERNFVGSLKEQGILDNNFDHVLDLRSTDNPRFVVEVISMFLNDADNCIAELNRHLNQPVINYARVINYAHQLKGSSSSIGGRQVNLACRELRYASDNMDRDRCFEAFNKLKDEYQILKSNINMIIQIERTIIASESRRRRRLLHP